MKRCLMWSLFGLLFWFLTPACGSLDGAGGNSSSSGSSVNLVIENPDPNASGAAKAVEGFPDVSANKATIRANVSSLTVTVSAPDMDTISKSFGVTSGVSQVNASLDIPSGDNRTISVELNDGSLTTNGIPFGYRGDTSTAIASGSNTVSISPKSLNLISDVAGDTVGTAGIDIRSVRINQPDSSQTQVAILFANALSSADQAKLRCYITMTPSETLGTGTNIIDQNRNDGKTTGLGSQPYVLCKGGTGTNPLCTFYGTAGTGKMRFNTASFATTSDGKTELTATYGITHMKKTMSNSDEKGWFAVLCGRSDLGFSDALPNSGYAVYDMSKNQTSTGSLNANSSSCTTSTGYDCDSGVCYNNTCLSLSNLNSCLYSSGQAAFVSSTALDGSWNGTATSSTNIWVINPDGTGMTALTKNSTSAVVSSTAPSISSDGPKIAFRSSTALDGSWNGTATSSTNIWIINADGTGMTALTKNSTSAFVSSSAPSISSDGSKIAFVSSTALDGSWNGTATSSTNIWIINADGTGMTALTKNSTSAFVNSTAPSISPDGSKIAFVSSTALDGSWNGTATSSTNIWIINADGTGMTALTKNSTSAFVSSSAPSISSDGSKVTFVSSTALDGSWNGTSTSSTNIWIINTDGTGMTALTKNSTGLTVSSSAPSISSDGTKVAFRSSTALDKTWDGASTSSTNIWVINADGTGMTALTKNSTGVSVSSSAPSISSDGSKVTFVSSTALDGSWNGTATSSTNIWVINADGSGMTALTKNSTSAVVSSSADVIKQSFVCP